MIGAPRGEASAAELRLHLRRELQLLPSPLPVLLQQPLRPALIRVQLVAPTVLRSLLRQAERRQIVRRRCKRPLSMTMTMMMTGSLT